MFIARVPIRMAVFDWSGVISDDRPAVYESNMRMLEGYGHPRISFEEWRMRSTLTPVEIMKNHGVQDSEGEIWSEYKRVFSEVKGEGMRPEMYNEVPATLNQIKARGVYVRVISGHPEEELLSEALEYGLDGLVDGVECDCRDKAGSIRELCEREGVSPEAAFYIGDTIYDVRAAKDAGVISVACASGYHSFERLEKERPDLILASLSELAYTGIFAKNWPGSEEK